MSQGVIDKEAVAATRSKRAPMVQRERPPLIVRSGVVASIALGSCADPRPGFLAHRVLYRGGRRDELALCGARTGEMVASIDPTAPRCERCERVEARA